MKKAIIIGHGNRPEKSVLQRYIGKNDLIICADGGAAYALAAGYIPHVVIGDLDSLSKAQQDKLRKYYIEWITYSKEKDQTDAELAISYALKKKFTRITIFGIYGSRVDQSLATILYISNVQLFDGQFTIVEADQEIQVISKQTTFKGKKGGLFSVIPLQTNAVGVSISGAKYDLDNTTIVYGSTLGISNEFHKTSVTITLRQGKLLLVRTIS